MPTCFLWISLQENDDLPFPGILHDTGVVRGDVDPACSDIPHVLATVVVVVDMLHVLIQAVELRLSDQLVSTSDVDAGTREGEGRNQSACRPVDKCRWKRKGHQNTAREITLHNGG